MSRKQRPWLLLSLLSVGALLVLVGLWLGVRRETQAMNQMVNEVSDLRDPSPFRAALWLSGFLLLGEDRMEHGLLDVRLEPASGGVDERIPAAVPKLRIQDQTDEQYL